MALEDGNLETREATVIKVTKAKKTAGSDWRLLQTSDRDYKKWVGIVGEDVTVGSHIVAEGYPKQGRDGWEFVVTALKWVETDHHAEITWLASEFSDIGPKRAKEISKLYPDTDSLRDMLFNRPQELTQIRGLTPARATAIGQQYQAFKAQIDATSDVVRLGVKPFSLAQKVVKAWGLNAADQIKEDPYALYEFDKVTFQVCDTIAEGLGLDPRDPRRFRGWVRDQLVQVGDGDYKKIHVDNWHSGDCLILAKNLLSGQEEFGFRFSERQIYDALYPSDSVRMLPKYTDGSTGILHQGGVMLSTIDDNERIVANKALELAQRPKIQLTFKPQMVTRDGKPLDESQQAAVMGLLTNGFACMTGGPGTGKTTTLKTALNALTNAGLSVKCAAPTGKAAKRMSAATGLPASTIHRLLGWLPEGFEHNASNPLAADVVVLDESSMIDIELAASLFAAIGERTRLLFVGDVDQLPPVGPGQPFYDLLRSGMVPTFRLTSTHRQAADSWVIANAHKIINGAQPSLQNTDDFRFVSTNRSEEIVRNVITIYRDARRDNYEDKVQVLCAERFNGAGTFLINQEVQRAMNPNARESNPQQVTIGKGDSAQQCFVGDKVLYTKNDVDLGLVNGDIGVVLDIQPGKDADSTSVFVRFDGFQSDDNPEGIVELRGAQYVPLLLAYAMTVHKSQGSEWSYVVVVVDRAHTSMRRQLLYTAVTRTSDKLVIIGSQNALQSAVHKPKDTNRNTRLVQRLKGEMNQ